MNRASQKSPQRRYARWCALRTALFCAISAFALANDSAAQHGAAQGQWRHYGADHGHSRYSPLDQINKSNVATLEVAWRWESVDHALPKSAGAPGQFKVTPLMVDGVLYASTAMSQV